MLRRILAVLGAAEVVAGTLLPVASISGGDVALLMPDGRVGWEGLALVGLAILAALLALLGQAKHVLWPALVVLCLVAWSFLDWQRKAGGAIGMEIPGWAVLEVGALTLLVAGLLPWRRRAGAAGATFGA